MSRSGIEQLLYMMDQAFESDIGENLMGNLATVPDDCWFWLPPGGGRRTVFELVRHLGQCKYVYDNHAFGDQSMRWDRPETMPDITESASLDEVIWLRDGHKKLRDHVVALPDDSELLRQRSGWSLDYTMETRKVISIMLLHDAYHAGEVNHIRALAQGND